MSEQMKIRTWVDGRLVEKQVNIPRTTTKERKAATRVRSWDIRAHYDGHKNESYGPIFSEDIPLLWEEVITDPTVKKAMLRRSHKVVSEYVRRENEYGLTSQEQAQVFESDMGEKFP